MASVLIIGSGAREHALGRAFHGHSLAFFPGNAGTASLGRNLPGNAEDVSALVRAGGEARADLVVIGPEKPLVMGAADALRAAGFAVFGPDARAARLEGSKSFMKEFCKRHLVPTADFRVFDDAEEAKAFVRGAARPLVVKADGLCAGKGVVVAQSAEEALAAIDEMMIARVFGEAGARVVIEEVLPGEEASFHVLVSGKDAVALVPAQDHKRALDGDLGPNTGGMGAYAPALVVDAVVHERVMNEIVARTVAGLAGEGIDFRGVLFVGLMIENGVPRVLEFNVRFGDPETSVVLPLLDGDPFAIFSAVAAGRLHSARVGHKTGAAVSVVLAAEHYPKTPATGDAIEGLDRAVPEGAWVLHAGTKKDGDRVVTSGGRVLAVGAHAHTFDEARARAYEVASSIHFRGMHYRRDIGHRALNAK
jgi:phosphoribosylamine--glycine ligase